MAESEGDILKEHPRRPGCPNLLGHWQRKRTEIDPSEEIMDSLQKRDAALGQKMANESGSSVIVDGLTYYPETK